MKKTTIRYELSYQVDGLPVVIPCESLKEAQEYGKLVKVSKRRRIGIQRIKTTEERVEIGKS